MSSDRWADASPGSSSQPPTPPARRHVTLRTVQVASRFRAKAQSSYGTLAAAEREQAEAERKRVERLSLIKAVISTKHDPQMTKYLDERGRSSHLGKSTFSSPERQQSPPDFDTRITKSTDHNRGVARVRATADPFVDSSSRPNRLQAAPSSPHDPPLRLLLPPSDYSSKSSQQQQQQQQSSSDRLVDGQHRRGPPPRSSRFGVGDRSSGQEGLDRLMEADQTDGSGDEMATPSPLLSASASPFVTLMLDEAEINSLDLSPNGIVKANKIVRQRYLERVSVHHPDKRGGSNENCQTVQSAYEQIQDYDSRDNYRQRGVAGGAPKKQSRTQHHSATPSRRSSWSKPPAVVQPSEPFKGFGPFVTAEQVTAEMLAAELSTFIVHKGGAISKEKGYTEWLEDFPTLASAMNKRFGKLRKFIDDYPHFGLVFDEQAAGGGTLSVVDEKFREGSPCSVTATPNAEFDPREFKLENLSSWREEKVAKLEAELEKTQKALARAKMENELKHREAELTWDLERRELARDEGLKRGKNLSPSPNIPKQFQGRAHYKASDISDRAGPSFRPHQQPQQPPSGNCCSNCRTGGGRVFPAVNHPPSAAAEGAAAAGGRVDGRGAASQDSRRSVTSGDAFLTSDFFGLESSKKKAPPRTSSIDDSDDGGGDDVEVVSSKRREERGFFEKVVSMIKPSTVVEDFELNFDWSMVQGHDNNILVLGGTGHGKSTFVDAIHNFFNDNDVDKLEPIIEQMNEQSRGDQTKSQTKTCKKYTFFNPKGTASMTFIDTPGLADTKGAAQDEENQKLIMQAAQEAEEKGSLKGIMFVMKGTENRGTLSVQTVCQLIKASMPDYVVENHLYLVFTNCFGENDCQAGRLIDFAINSKKKCYVQNSAFLREWSAVKRDRDYVKKITVEWEVSRKNIKKLLTEVLNTHKLPYNREAGFGALFQTRQQMKLVFHEIKEKIVEHQSTLELMEEAKIRIQDAERNAKAYGNYEISEEVETVEWEETPYHNTVCSTCNEVCHAHCGLNEIAQAGDNAFKGCAAFGGTNTETCKTCSGKCNFSTHYHTRKVPRKVKKTIKKVLEDLKKQYEGYAGKLRGEKQRCKTYEDAKSLIDASIIDMVKKLHDVFTKCKTICKGVNLVDDLSLVLRQLEGESRLLRNIAAKESAMRTIKSIKSMIEAANKLK